MGKRALGIGLTLLSIALWVGPIVVAFGSHNWSIKETVAPSQDQIEDIQDRLENVMGDGGVDEDVFSIVDNDVVGEDISITIEFSPPFDFPVTIQDFSVEISREGTGEVLANLTIAQEDKGLGIGPQGTGTIHLTGEYTGPGDDLPNDAEISGGTLKFDVYGVEVDVSLEELDGGGSESGGAKTSPEERKKEAK